MSECLCFIADPPVFPRRPANRPGLNRIKYRIGVYADFRSAMLRQLNVAPALLSWTHREPDEPAIALIEGAAILGDILTFYQDLYANEAYLRTAQWRESVAELVRLLGYRLAPGIGGHGAFAFEVKGTSPITIPAGFDIQADLENSTEPAQFETVADAVAYPHLSRFRLYRTRNYSPGISSGTSKLELQSVEGFSTPDALASANLKPGDRLMLVPEESMWSANVAFTSQAQSQIVKLTKVTHTLDRTILEFDGHLVDNWTAPVSAYRIGRSFRHFGHNAPPTVIDNLVDSSTGKITGSTQSDTVFRRHFDWECYDSSMSVSLPVDLMPLDQEVNDLSIGARLIIRALVEFDSHSTIEPLIVVKEIRALRSANVGFGNLNGQSTFVTVDSKLVTNPQASGALGDMRDVQILEVTGPAMQLRNVATFDDGLEDNTRLQFYSTWAQVTPLAGRRLLLQHDDGRVLDCACGDSVTAFTAPTGADFATLWAIHLDKIPDDFLKQDFDEAAPKVTALGNIIEGTQGKTERDAVLGNGDNRQMFQTFKLPKSPLTYLPAAGTPPQTPELEIRVNDLLWKRVDSFFGHGPKEEIYIVREDPNGDSFVQFGDSESGARLPSGVNNVTAHFRTGTSAHGKIKSGAKPQAATRLNGLDKLQLPGVIAGGADPETPNKARDAAPGKVQSLGRLVSLRDFETETLGIGGVTNVSAAWALDAGVPSVQLIVLLEAGRASEIESVRQTIAEYQHCRGPNRFPVHVIQGILRYVYLDVQFAFDPRLEREVIEQQIRVGLGVDDSETAKRFGLFAVRNRRFGEREYATRVAGTVQNVPGIRWCKPTAFGLLAVGDDPTALTLPPDPKALNAIVPCGETEILQVYPAHLRLVAAAPPPTDPCDS
jgi:hypothetical protein